MNSPEGAGGSGPRDPYNYHLDYSPLSSSQPQVWVTAIIWNAFGGHTFSTKLLQETAGGWQFGGIASINSGTPLDLVSGIDNSLTGIGEDYAGRHRQLACQQHFESRFHCALVQPSCFYSKRCRNLRDPPAKFSFGPWLCQLRHKPAKELCHYRTV